MRDDSIQYAIDERVRTLFAQDPIAFLTHWFAIAVLVAICRTEAPDSRLFVAWIIFYGILNCAHITMWIWHGCRPDVFSPRGWIILHAVCGLLLYGAPALSIWFVLDGQHAGFPLLHMVLLVMLAVGILMSVGFDILNFSTSLPLLLPVVVLYFSGRTLDRNVVALVLVFVFVTISVYSLNYRKLFRRVMLAQVDQQDLAQSLDLQKHVAEEASLARTHFFAAASRDLRQPLRAIGLLARSLKDMTIIPHSVYRWQVALWRRSKS